MKFAHQEREVTAIFAISVKDPLTDNQTEGATKREKGTILIKCNGLTPCWRLFQEMICKEEFFVFSTK